MNTEAAEVYTDLLTRYHTEEDHKRQSGSVLKHKVYYITQVDYRSTDYETGLSWSPGI